MSAVIKRLVFAALAAALAGCAALTAVEPGPLKTDAGFSVDLQNAWTRFPVGAGGLVKGTVITRHGLPLNRIDMVTVAPGGALVSANKTAQVPRFRADQGDIELVELVTATLTRLGFANVSARNVRPAKFVGAAGLRFEVTGAYESGLRLRGDVALAKVDGKLHVMWLIAPEIHYFDASNAEFDAMVTSSRLSG